VGGFIAGRLVSQGRGSPEGDLGQLYHEWSKPDGASLAGLVLDWGAPAQPTKSYPDAPRVSLPTSLDYGDLGVGEAIEMRRSRREYASGPLEMGELSVLVHAASGVTDPSRGFRAAPSAGALYPIETYVVVHNAEGLEQGLYHYAVADHELEQLRVDDLRARMMIAGLGQEMLGRAQVCFILTAVFGRTRQKYRERTYRYVMLEAGHISQNLYLAATSLGLGACAIGAFLDNQLNSLLDVDGQEEAAVYMVTVGKLIEDQSRSFWHYRARV
jgi:SagB-type dehydrogenase family enzyme